MNDYNLNLELNIKFKCNEGERTEVEKRLLNAIIEQIKTMEGLFTTSPFIPLGKSYYFSVREVNGKIIK